VFELLQLYFDYNINCRDMLYMQNKNKMSNNHFITVFQYVTYINSNMLLENGESFASHL
jgi:hypothetical protein